MLCLPFHHLDNLASTNLQKIDVVLVSSCELTDGVENPWIILAMDLLLHQLTRDEQH